MSPAFASVCDNWVRIYSQDAGPGKRQLCSDGDCGVIFDRNGSVLYKKRQPDDDCIGRWKRETRVPIFPGERLGYLGKGHDKVQFDLVDANRVDANNNPLVIKTYKLKDTRKHPKGVVFKNPQNYLMMVEIPQSTIADVNNVMTTPGYVVFRANYKACEYNYLMLTVCPNTQCSDNIDNDRDGQVDLDDAGCFGDPNRDNERLDAIINPVVTINGSDDQTVVFGKNASDKNAIVSWTITNTGLDPVIVKSVTGLGCTGDISCRFVGFREIKPVPADSNSGDRNASISGQTVLESARVFSFSGEKTASSKFPFTPLHPAPTILNLQAEEDDPPIDTFPIGPTINVIDPENLDFNFTTNVISISVQPDQNAVDISSITVDLNNASSTFDLGRDCEFEESDEEDNDSENEDGNNSGGASVSCEYTERNLIPIVHTRLVVRARDVNGNQSSLAVVFRYVKQADANGQKQDANGYRFVLVEPPDGRVILKRIDLSKQQVGEILSKGPSATVGLVIKPGESIVVTESVQLPKSVRIPATNNLGLHVIFDDSVFGNSDINEPSTDTVKLTRIFTEEKKFNIELIGGDQGFCIGRDGRLGATGKTAVPRVLLSWDWSDITLNTCEQKGQFDSNVVYCDPAQFSIALLKRLDRVYELAKDGKVSQASSLTKFRAWLMQDNINSDFRKDFDFYYTQTGFFNASAFYDDPETPWNLYFTNPARLKFSPENLSAGLYDVEIIVDSSAGPLSFFDSGGLAGVIDVKLSKISEPDSINPFYLLPLNGGVGLFGADSDGRIERKGYGVKFNGDSVPITPEFSTSSQTGEKTVDVELLSDFTTLNINKRENVLSLSQNAADLEFSPSFATPVAMVVIDANEARAEGFYYLLKNNQALPVPGNYGTLWTGFGSSPMQCKNFDNSTVYYRKNDSRAVPESCVDQSIGTDSFGFRFTSIPPENRNGRMFLETVFYTAVNDDTRLRNACQQKQTIFASPTQGPNSGDISLGLRHRSSGVSIEEVFSKIATGALCASIDAGAMEIWWNPQTVSADLNAVKETLIATSPTPVICRLPPEIALLPSQ